MKPRPVPGPYGSPPSVATWRPPTVRTTRRSRKRWAAVALAVLLFVCMLVCLLTPALQILTVAPSILGIGQPARYLVLFMDRSELRPGGGFQGNFGILTMDGGRPSTSAPLTLQDVYQLDQRYYQNPKNA